MASRVDLPTPEPAKMPMRWPAQSGVKKSMTRTPLFIGRFTRSRVMAAGGSASIGTERGPSSRGPRPSTGAPRALITRPFQERCGFSRIGRERNAGLPTPASTRVSKDLIVTPETSILTTSPGDARPSPLMLTTSPSLRWRDRPETR